MSSVISSLFFLYIFQFSSTYALDLYKLYLALSGSTWSWNLVTPINDNSSINVNIYSLLLCVRYFAKCFTNMILFNPHNNYMT